MEQEWHELAVAQEGVITRTQLLSLEMTPRQARRNVDNRRWQVLRPGVYLTHSGPPSDLARVWAAVLFSGGNAIVGGRTALWLAQALPQLEEPVEICVPHPKPTRPAEGIRFHQVRGLAQRRATAPGPPRLQLEHAVLDVADHQARPEPVCDVVLRVLQQRLLTRSMIMTALAGRSRHRWRELINDVLSEFADGTHSVLERRYRHAVESSHRLPKAVRNQPETDADGRRRYRDVRYESYRLVVELDGQEAHPQEEAFRDLRRDNALVLGGETVLRYGWRDVAGRPCVVAHEVAHALITRGWAGAPSPCSPACGLHGPAIG